MDNDEVASYVPPFPLGTRGGAGKLVGDHFETKVVGVGCVHHSTERLHSALFRLEFGPTVAPQESFAKSVKQWFNSQTNINCEKVKQILTSKEREGERERERKREKERQRERERGGREKGNLSA